MTFKIYLQTRISEEFDARQTQWQLRLLTGSAVAVAARVACQMSLSCGKMAKQYPKRSGTSGMRRPLYETKLLSLIYFRAIHDDNIEEFHLATNVDKLESFGDICFKAKFRGNDKLLAVFLQAKHRENDNSVLTLNETDLVEYFNIYLEVRRNLNPNNKDVLFKSTLGETECVFVIYTNAKGDKKSSTYEGSFSKHLNDLISTGVPGSQSSHNDKDVELLCEILLKEQMKVLARQMAKCIFGEFNDIRMLMQDDLVLQYHVLLGQKAFDISDIQPEGHRNLSFRDDFFDIDEEYLRLFKDELCTEFLKRRRCDNREYGNLSKSLTLLRQLTDTETLYKVFGSRFIYENGKIVLIDEKLPDSGQVSFYQLTLFLDKTNESKENIRNTVEIAVKNCLTLQRYKVPASFGNKDLTIRGNYKKIQRKLNDLTFKIVRFIEQSKPSNIVTIDDSFGKEFLKLSDGIASAVGNLLVFDETTKLMKFNDNYESLGNLSKDLYRKLKKEINNLQEYRFDVKAKVFPKLSFASATNEYNKIIVSEFLSTLLFFTSQSSEKELEETLIYEINNNQGADVQHVKVTSDAVYLKYHDEIQRWSMESDVGMGTYLEKEGSIYKDAVKHVTAQSLMSVINMMQIFKYKNKNFRKDAVNAVQFDDLPSGTIIVTENSELTVTKFIKHFNNKNIFLIDLEYVLNLSARDDQTLRRELMNKDKVKTLIVVFNNAQINHKLKNLASSMKSNIVIIITDQNSVDDAKIYFSQTGNIIKDAINLIDMSEESQKRILGNTEVIFQGKKVSLEHFLINNTIRHIGTDVLDKMMHSNKNTVGKPVSNSNYNPELYIQRSVKPFCWNTGIEESVNRKQIETLDDFENDVIVILGDPGMGKSTFLTHLSLKTKDNWGNPRWKVRVDLLEYTPQFRKWKDMKTNIDATESLKFLCQVALSEESSKTLDMNISLVQCDDGTVFVREFQGDAWTLFELRMFLNFYNSAQLIILFDGFDEICPTYANEVFALIKTVKNFSKTHKIWITSRSYAKMHSIFESFNSCQLFELERLNLDEQDIYLSNIWDEKDILSYLITKEFQNISDCVTYVAGSKHIGYLFRADHILDDLKRDMPYFLVGLSLIKYLKTNLSRAPTAVKQVIDRVYKCLTSYQAIKPKLAIQSKFVATPLHLNIMADYLYNKIKEINIKQKDKWDWHYSIFNIYEYYLENKMRNSFQEKTFYDMSIPENISAREREYADCIGKHKKLAAYSVYYRFRSKLFNDDELKLIMELIEKLKEGKERNGIICNVVDDIPLFVHSKIEEYLAVEYFCSLIKSKENKIPIWDFILNVVCFGNINVIASLDVKMKVDHDMISQFEQNKKDIFDLLIKQGKNNKPGEIKSSISEVIRYGLRNLTRFFIFPTLNGNINENNLMDFIELVRETNMLLLAAKMEYDDVIAALVNHVKRIDITKLCVLFENIELNENIAELNIEDLIQKLYSYVWAQMDIVPDWEKIIKSSNQIYFF